MLDIENGKVLIIVKFNRPASSISILALAKRYKITFIKKLSNSEASYRIDIALANTIVDEINKCADKSAKFTNLLKPTKTHPG
jgi:hypothetical protein